MTSSPPLDSPDHSQQTIADQLLTAIANRQALPDVYALITQGLQQGLGGDRVVLVQYSRLPHQVGRIVAQATAPGIPLLKELDAEADASWFPLLPQLPHQELWVMTNSEQEALKPIQREFCQALGLKSVLHLPITLENRPWGSVNVQQLTSPRAWTAADRQFVHRLGQLLGLGLIQADMRIQRQNQVASVQTILAESNYQKEEHLKAAQRQRTLSDVIDKIRLTLDLQTLFQTTVTEVVQLLKADRVMIIKILDVDHPGVGEVIAEAHRVGEGVQHRYCALPSRENVSLSTALITHFRRGLILAIDDVEEMAITLTLPPVGSPRANLMVPLFTGDCLWGMLSVHQCQTPRAWESSEIEFALKIALNLGVAIQQAELLAESQRRSHQLQKALGEVQAQKDNLMRIADEEKALTRVIEGIRQTLDLETIFRATTEEVRHLLGCDRVLVYRFNPDWSGEFIHESVAKMWLPLIMDKTKLPVWEDTYLQETGGGRYRHRESFAIEDVETASFTDCHLDNLRRFEIRAFLTVPVFVGDRLWGLLGAYQNCTPRHWQPREQYLLEQIANQLGVAVYQAQLLHRVQEQSKTMENTLADLTAIVDNLADGLLVTDIEGHITRYNPALLAMFDLQGIDLQGAALESYFPAALTTLWAEQKQQQAGVTTADVSLSHHRQGQALITSITNVLQGGKETQCLGSVIMIRDVTQEREVERMKTDFLATVSHELRTPLTSILGFASVIQDKLNGLIFPQVVATDPKVVKGMDRVQRNLGIIESEADRLTALINDVLDIAKMEAGEMVWTYQPCRLAPILHRAIATLKPQAQSKNIALTLEIEANLPLFSGDENRILQVVLNLLSNAIKFTDTGRIITQAQREQGHLKITIIDSGPGIRPEDQHKIFEPFQQGGDVLTSKPQGTGLGLPICQQIIEHHGGTINVTSTLGQGSTFYFTLPIDFGAS
ncbi:MAG: GAF domain-containing protein, partial [Synechocystis sp.]|nr:GAF domain-containing protein [Synechocystis sp.]